MYKLLIVDDELEIREGLREVVPFGDYGFEVVGEAANGPEGVQKAMELLPDLIITDIRMPLMDGLTMCKEIQKSLPTTHFIILSGYDDFEYARQAIELHTMGYLLKPISSAEFKTMLSEMRTRLDEDFAKRRDLAQLKRHYTNSLPLLKEMLLSSLLSGGLSASKALATAQSYAMPLSAPCYAIALMRTDHARHPDAEDELSDPVLLAFAVMNILREILQSKETVHVFHYDGQIAALFLMEQGGGQAQENLIKHLNETRRNVLHYLEVDLLIGLSAQTDSLSSLSVCARQAASALSQSSIYGGDNVLCITDMEPGSRQAISPDDQAMRELISALKTNDVSQIESQLQVLTEACEQHKPTLKNYRAYLLEIMMSLFYIIRDMDVDDADYENVLKTLLRCPPPGEALRLLQDIYVKTAEEIASRRADTGSRIALQAQDYIRKHHAQDNLNMETLCRELHISSSYFSMIFKKESGKTFHHFLTEIRMSKAMTLLAAGGMRTSEVAEAVGIPDPSYFSYVFKKHFGMSPSQVRRKQEGSL